MTRKFAILTAIALLATMVVANPASARHVREYRVTITNLTDGQPLTPALAATHNRKDGFFRVWRPASDELQQIAENGNLAPMMARIAGDRDFFDSEVGFGPTIDPILPGQTATFTIEASPRFSYLSWASMLICTNDGFTGVNRLRLPGRVGKSVTRYTKGYDAGTEDNTEAWEDLVPPCAVLTGFGDDNGGTGMSDPALAEGRRIHRHRGIVGDADLQVDPHDWHGPVAKITIERIG